MSKTKRAYFGYDSQKNQIEVAQSESGNWFYRVLKFDGYRKSWCRWTHVEKEILHPTKRPNKGEMSGSLEYVFIPSHEQEDWIEWGFGLLEKFNFKTNFRLPY